MSLPVPLAVAVNGVHITGEVEGLSIRREAVGGVRSIAFALSRPLDALDADLAPYREVVVSDTRSGEIVASGLLSDPGRSAAAADGERWSVVAFGPAQHAADRTIPYVIVTQDQTSFVRGAFSTKNATTANDERGDEDPSLIHMAEEGKTVSTSWQGVHISRVMYDAGMKLARVRCQVECGITAGNFEQQLRTQEGSGSASTADSRTASTTSGFLSAVVVTDFSNGDDVTLFRTVRNTSSTTGVENHWFEYWDIYQRALLLDSDGSEITTGYSNNHVLAHEVVKDVVGRMLVEVDSSRVSVDEGGTFNIDQLAYPDGVTAEQVLEDLMLLEPAYRWVAGPNTLTGVGYSFTWEPWPTTVRYETTLDGGGDFPSSAQELFNEVTVRWRDKRGRQRTTTRTAACVILDDYGTTRTALLDLGDEVGSLTQAQRAGDNFLADHNVPRNAGTLTVSQPVWDLTTRRLVRPHEIEPGELIRVRGIHAYPDSLNADGFDGQTVFRIWSSTYSSESDSAQLELDTYARTTANALARLTRRRRRRR